MPCRRAQVRELDAPPDQRSRHPVVGPRVESDEPAGLRFSIVVAVRNGAKTLQRAMDSVFEQTYGNVELIVIDGASTDGTPGILERNDARISYWESEPDRGIYHAWNKALDHVTGDWIAFLGSDDRYHDPGVLARMATAIAADDGAHQVVYGYLDKTRLDGLVVRSTIGPWTESRRRFLRGTNLPHPATFHHRSLFEPHGRFDERFRIAGDYEFLLRELLDHDALFVPEVVVDMAGGGVSDLPGNEYTVQREVYLARYMHGLVKSPPSRSPALYRRLIRVWLWHTLGPRVTRRIAAGYRFFARKPRQR
jgi:glycosyltransferase involved in cell wall biosynthesis